MRAEDEIKKKLKEQENFYDSMIYSMAGRFGKISDEQMARYQKWAEEANEKIRLLKWTLNHD